MTHAPEHIDGARVLLATDLSTSISTGETRHVVGDDERNDFAALAVAQYEEEDGVYLLYCDDDWDAITDTHHDSVEQAITQAESEFGPLRFRDLRAEADA